MAAGVAVGAAVGASVGAAVGVAAAELQAPTTIAAAMIMAPKRRVPLSNVVSPLPLWLGTLGDLLGSTARVKVVL
jgi:hypothetical protein